MTYFWIEVVTHFNGGLDVSSLDGIPNLNTSFDAGIFNLYWIEMSNPFEIRDATITHLLSGV